MNTTTPIRLNIVTEFADEPTTRLADKIIAGMGDDELTRNNILALCTMLNQTLHTAEGYRKEMERQVEECYNKFASVIDSALDKRRDELQREAVAKAFGVKTTKE